MIEIKTDGDWPETAIEDVGCAWTKLDKFSPQDTKVVLIGPSRLTKKLDAQYKKTTWTYASIIKQNFNIDRVIHLSGRDESFVLLCAYKINGDNYPELVFHTNFVKIHTSNQG